MVLLVAYPFHLSSNEAELLARYIIEDSSEEYPYCHEENKIERAIVKSIVKAFVGEYAIPNQV